jgi:regulator of cell morphogenesis and NO signaling
MNTYREARLSDIANASEEARKVLDQFGLDFCCAGEQSLGDACNKAGVDLAMLEAKLHDAHGGQGRDWRHEGITPLLDTVLSGCHPLTTRLLAEARALAKALMKIDPRTRAFADAVEALSTHALAQMHEEEEPLFARVRALANARKGRGPYPEPPFRTIHEHEERVRRGHARTHELLRRARTLGRSLEGRAGEDAQRRLEAAGVALMEQMHLENNELLPRARALEPNGQPRAHG